VDLKDIRVAKPLAALLQDRMKTHYAGNALIRMGSSAEPAVLALLSSEDPTTRKRAAEVLANIGTSASLPALQRAAKDKDFFAKVAADRALNAIKARPPEATPR
jgi:HEAT repeat protein